YKCADISAFVKKGKNTLAVITDRMFDTNRLSSFVAQINCGEKIALVSDGGFRAAEYTPLLAGANFFVEGPAKSEVFDARKDSFAPAFFCGFDDSAWVPAACESEEAVSATFTRISQDKNEMQTSTPVYAKSYVSFEKSEAERGLPIEIKGENGGFVLCETEITAERECELTVEMLGGAFALSVGGKRAEFGKKISLPAGTHRMALAGRNPKIFVRGEGFVLGKWKKAEPKKPDDMKKRPPHFPWNDLAEEEKLPEKVECFLTSKAPLAMLDAGKTACELTAFEKIKYRKYISCADSVCDERPEKAAPREKTGESLGVSGRESIFAAGGEMRIAPSEKDITFVLDFGKVRVGGIYLEAAARAGVQIDICAFEAINGGGFVLDGERRMLSYICKDGENRYLSHTRKGFRYLLVNIPARESEVVLGKLCLYEWRYPAESRTGFTCSDARLNEVYKMSLDTAKVCMLDAYVDCPGYEQNIWVGDAGVTALVNLYNFGCYDFNERFLSLVASSLDGGMARIYRRGNKRYVSGKFLPCASFPTYPEGNIPIWSYMWLLSIADHYDFTGDREALLALLPAAEETFARSLGMTSERGLLSINGAWNLIEWGNNDVCEYGECTANSMMLAYCFRKFAGIFEMLGEKEKAAEYARHGEEIKAAVNKYAWSEERGAYLDTVRDARAYEKYLAYYEEIGKTPLSFEKYMSLARVSVQTNTFAVLYGIAEGERREKALAILAQNVEKGVYISGSPAYRTAGTPSEAEAPGGIVHIGSPFFMYFALGALFENGYAHLALKSIAREWGDMLDAGVTTCTESFNSKTEWKTRSVAHAWSASPAIYMMSELLGVKPLAPGFAEFTVSPCKSTLTFAKGSVPTPHGEIYVEWERAADGKLKIHCEAPKACKRV
ncbi:MAG: family 78 glycoside hydrolase catalytic domain, partial [Clostridia bacterium]|nr:family 78 glycoside hydrolase catalytic domain [Clostridia bacterium]